MPLGDRDLEVNPQDDYVIVWAVRMTDMAGFLLDLTADEPLPRENDEPFPPLDRAERVLRPVSISIDDQLAGAIAGREGGEGLVGWMMERGSVHTHGHSAGWLAS